MILTFVVGIIARGGSEPFTVENGAMRVNVGATVYTVNGLTIAISCNVIAEESPITISWSRNGEPDQSRENVSTIEVTDATHCDVFTCRVENGMGFDHAETAIRFTISAFCIHDP